MMERIKQILPATKQVELEVMEIDNVKLVMDIKDITRFERNLTYHFPRSNFVSCKALNCLKIQKIKVKWLTLNFLSIL